MRLPIIKVSRFFTRGNSGTSFGIFIFVKDKDRLNDKRLINHEMIHYVQQKELLFIVHWVLYGMFYVIERLKGKTHSEAKHTNPFEAEAYANDDNLDYLRTRKMFAWAKWV